MVRLAWRPSISWVLHVIETTKLKIAVASLNSVINLLDQYGFWQYEQALLHDIIASIEEDIEEYPDVFEKVERGE